MANPSVVTSGKTVDHVEASMARLRAILEDAAMRRRGPKETFEAFEKRVHEQLQAVEREILAEDLERADVDAEAVVMEGATYRRVLRAEETVHDGRRARAGSS